MNPQAQQPYYNPGMQGAAPQPHAPAAPPTAPLMGGASKTDGATQGAPLVRSPLWVLIVRGFQILFSFIVVGMAGRFIVDVYLHVVGLAVATVLMSWVAVAYILMTENISGLQPYWNMWAVLGLDSFLWLMWLSTFASVATINARFVSQGTCDDNTSCLVIGKRAPDGTGEGLYDSGKAILTATSVFGAFEWLLFSATIIFLVVAHFKHRKGGPGRETAMEMKPHPVEHSSQPAAATGGNAFTVAPQQTGQSYQPSEATHAAPYTATQGYGQQQPGYPMGPAVQAQSTPHPGQYGAPSGPYEMAGQVPMQHASPPPGAAPYPQTPH